MFVKVTDDLVVNTDQVCIISLGANMAELFFVAKLKTGDLDRASVVIPLAAAHWLLNLVEANTALVLDAQITPATLTSKLAQLLRDTLPNGATAKQLAELTNADTTATYEALGSLDQERVVLCKSTPLGAIWYHASNAPKATAPAAPLADFHSRDQIYTWECRNHPILPHVNVILVSNKDFQAGILYCDQCAQSHILSQATIDTYNEMPIPSLDPSPATAPQAARPGPDSETTADHSTSD